MCVLERVKMYIYCMIRMPAWLFLPPGGKTEGERAIVDMMDAEVCTK